MMLRRACVGIGLLALAGMQERGAPSPGSGEAASEVASPSHALDGYLALPIRFERNDGQLSPDVRYVGRGGGGAVVLRDASATVLARHHDGAMSAVTLTVPGARGDTRPAGEVPLAAKSHFYLGSDPAAWHTDVPNYAQVAYRQVRPGVDVVFHGRHGGLEYDMHLAPGLSAGDVPLRVSGADSLVVTATGDLEIHTGDAVVVQSAPHAYQQVDGREQSRPARFEIRGTDEIAFQVEGVDRSASWWSTRS